MLVKKFFKDDLSIQTFEEFPSNYVKKTFFFNIFKKSMILKYHYRYTIQT